MDSRERTFLALAHEEPDRVPRDFWASKGTRANIERSFGTSWNEFLDRHDFDLRYIEGPRYVGPRLRSLPDGTSEDLWGVRRKPVRVPLAFGEEVYQEVAFSPLAEATTPAEVHGYARWPSADWFDYGPVRAQCQEIRDQGRVVVFMGDRLNRLAQLKPGMYLRGVEQILTDMVMQPEVAAAVFQEIRGFYAEYGRRIFEAADAGIDILLTGDDFGSQNGPLVSPAMWRNFLADGFEEYVRLGKAYGAKVMHHTCGGVIPIVPMMVERGLDVLQSLQPDARGMDLAKLKENFGGRLSFHGGISIQHTLPFGSPEDVRQEVKRAIETLAPGGGYILCTAHNIQADTSPENISALLQAYDEFGLYRKQALTER